MDSMCQGINWEIDCQGGKSNIQQVKNTVLKALATEPEYKVKIEVIRQTQPNILLNDLWLSVGRLQYSLENNEVVFAAMKLTLNAKEKQKQKYREKEEKVKRCYVCGKKRPFFISMSRQKGF